MRRLIAFPCAGETLLGTLDDAAGATGVLIVSGGNELRIGAHRGMASLAQRLAAAGVPVFRFDRRGIGDSSGSNGGYLTSGPDLAAAVASFRAEAGTTRVLGFGNCDAATALALHGAEAGVDGIILANPWLREEADALPPAAAIRSRYAERLRDPRAWLRLLRGGVDLRRLASGVAKASRRPDGGDRSALDAIAGTSGPILLARGDATARAFESEAQALAARFRYCETASHSFAGPGDADWLFRAIMMVAEEGLEPPTRGL